MEQEEAREGQQQEDGFVFTVDGDSSKSGAVSLTVGRAGLHDILIDSEAVSNVISALTWENLKRKWIKVISQEKAAKELFA